MHCQLGQMERAVERSGGVGKKGVKNMRYEVKLLSERQEILKGMVEDKIKNHEQFFEEMKELENKNHKRL